MEDFLRAFSKEYANAKKYGNVDEQESDPITAPLFCRVCQWSLFEGNVFVWCFGLLQWNLMARTASIDSLSLHNMKRGKSDSITFTHDATKSDMSGQFTSEKNVYSNPLEPEVDCFLALGIWMSLKQSGFVGSERFFVTANDVRSTSSQKFCRQIATMFTRHIDETRRFVRTLHANAYGIRKVRNIA